MLSSLDAPEFPLPLGILWQSERPAYQDALQAQVDQAQTRRPDAGDLQALLDGSQTWEVQ
jgi:hypothetical protein